MLSYILIAILSSLAASVIFTIEAWRRGYPLNAEEYYGIALASMLTGVGFPLVPIFALLFGVSFGVASLLKKGGTNADTNKTT